MKTASTRPIGFTKALAAELRFLLALRWIGIGLLSLAAFAVNRLVDRRGLLFMTPPWVWLWILAAIWASIAWSGERPDERECFAGAPFPAAWHELARVNAGAVFLVLPIASMLLGQDVFQTRFSPHSSGPVYVAVSILGPLTIYLIVSSVALISVWPAAWVVGMLAGLNLLALKAPTLLAWPASRFFSDRGFGFLTAMIPVHADAQTGWTVAGVGFRAWGPAGASWLGVAVLLLLTIAHRRTLARAGRLRLVRSRPRTRRQ